MFLRSWREPSGSVLVKPRMVKMNDLVFSSIADSRCAAVGGPPFLPCCCLPPPFLPPFFGMASAGDWLRWCLRRPMAARPRTITKPSQSVTRRSSAIPR
eukprot:scaffold17636_cov120-Isochrysis_galbana.AAC.8